MKFLLLLALAVMAFRLVAGRWPWQPGRGLGRGGQGRVTAEARAQAQALLGVAPGAPRAEIIEAIGDGPAHSLKIRDPIKPDVAVGRDVVLKLWEDVKF